MTSDAKGNHERVAELCAASCWFARGEANFTLFRQPMVPMVREGDGKWLVPRSCAPLMKPGGHGVIWKLMLDSGVFGWFKARGREAALLRQISNPLAGTDDTMLALAGEGLEKEGRAFGFASCERKVGASEGCNVVVEKTLPDGQGFSYCVSNIEYTEFDRLGIQDVCAASAAGRGDRETSAFPANTNILYIGLDAIERKVRQGANNGYLGAHIILPGMLINLSKTTTYIDEDTGREVAEKAGRLECTMQNIADSLGQVYPSPQGEHADLDTCLIYNGRSKVTSSAKKKRREGVVTDAALRQTPDGSFLDLVRNGREILAGQGRGTQRQGTAWITRFRNPTEIEHHLKQLLSRFFRPQLLLHGIRQELEKAIQIVGDPLRAHGICAFQPSSKIAVAMAQPMDAREKGHASNPRAIATGQGHGFAPHPAQASASDGPHHQRRCQPAAPLDAKTPALRRWYHRPAAGDPVEPDSAWHARAELQPARCQPPHRRSLDAHPAARGVCNRLAAGGSSDAKANQPTDRPSRRGPPSRSSQPSAAREPCAAEGFGSALRSPRHAQMRCESPQHRAESIGAGRSPAWAPSGGRAPRSSHGDKPAGNGRSHSNAAGRCQHQAESLPQDKSFRKAADSPQGSGQDRTRPCGSEHRCHR